MRHLKIFIVDDDWFCTNVYKQQLKNIGFTNIHTYNNGEECLKNIGMNPDIIIIDYYMSLLDGVQVIRIIKSMYPHIALLMISGQAEKQLADDALKYGALAYIYKDGKELDTLSMITKKIASGQHFFNPELFFSNVDKYTMQ